MYHRIAPLFVLLTIVINWASALVIDKINADESKMWSGTFLSEAARRDLLQVNSSTAGPSPCYMVTHLVGNGNPHINYYNKQVTNTVSGCNQPGVTCTTAKTSGHTFGWSVNADGSPTKGPLEWISGGFGVSESYSTGLSQGCTAGPPDNSVCEWFQQAYVAYTVETAWSSPLCGQSHSYIIWSPTNNNACGLGYYCVVNSCRSLGQGYWTLSGPAGSC